MTTSSWASVIDHTTDAGFRAWGGGATEMNGQLAAVGLIQTADTGQINWTTVTRPATNTIAGYEIWRFADSTLFLKIAYGTGPTATTPQMWITVGTGSNGSGTLTGATSTQAIFTSGSSPISTATVYTSRICRIADAMSLIWKEAMTSIGSIGGMFCVGKTVDGTGAATTTGFGVLRNAMSGSASSSSLQSVRTAATAVTFVDYASPVIIPGGVSSSTVPGGNSQAYALWLNVPDVQPFNWANVIINAEAARDTTFVVAMTGTTTHTYVSTGQIGNQGFNNANLPAATYGHGVIYE